MEVHGSNLLLKFQFLQDGLIGISRQYMLSAIVTKRQERLETICFGFGSVVNLIKFSTDYDFFIVH